MSYTQADVARLGEVLESIDLGDGERAALEALVGFAARKPSELEALSHACPAERRQGYCHVLNEILFEPVS